MARMSASEAAAHLGVTEARVRQRIDDGSLVAEKVGGRWLLELSSVDAAKRPARGRPISPLSVWYSMLALDAASLVNVPSVELPKIQSVHVDVPKMPKMPKMQVPNIDFARIDLEWPSGVAQVKSISPASRNRAVHRLASALAREDHDALLAWLRNRGDRHLYIAAEADLKPLRDDERLVPSGLSHPDSKMSNPSVAEGYVAEADLGALVQDHWLEAVSLDDKPNVILHAVPAKPPRISWLLLAADLAEHGGPRELRRAHELLDEVIADRVEQS
ncbi:helix-turn-helix domain-containing protein [Nocardioides sp. WS12]|uniref:helix-turn-helix domain-containing protein n=1 Tax=Nocardioides sp. WS12 TaxID=2486272 RepID=UPI0015FCFE7C|nr:helix-turn-helix domain-containing protein [Nocardioides sp. WS12]